MSARQAITERDATIADRVRMLGFVQDQLTARNKQVVEFMQANAEYAKRHVALVERERQLREALRGIGWPKYAVSADELSQAARSALAASPAPVEIEKPPQLDGLCLCPPDHCANKWIPGLDNPACRGQQHKEPTNGPL